MPTSLHEPWIVHFVELVPELIGRVRLERAGREAAGDGVDIGVVGGELGCGLWIPRASPASRPRRLPRRGPRGAVGRAGRFVHYSAIAARA